MRPGWPGLTHGCPAQATFSAGVCGAKAHIVYDPDAVQPVYLQITKANVNDITAAQAMPVEAGATYVFDLGYYDYAWRARLHQAGCRIVTRLKVNTPFETAEERAVPAGSPSLATGPDIFPNGWPPPAKIRCRILCAKSG